MATLKPQSNGPLYSNSVIVTLAEEGHGRPARSPPRCTKCSSLPINGQCTNFILFDVALYLPLISKGLNPRNQSARFLLTYFITRHSLVRMKGEVLVLLYFLFAFLSTISRQPAGRFKPNFACGCTLVPDVSSPLLG